MGAPFSLVPKSYDRFNVVMHERVEVLSTQKLLIVHFSFRSYLLSLFLAVLINIGIGARKVWHIPFKSHAKELGNVRDTGLYLLKGHGEAEG